jgi:group I intron endonuclease
VITYAAINLTNKKFYVGSTTDFNRRCKEHHTEKNNPEFHRSLRKNPKKFYWIVSEDDGLETRDEEQFYLDFYTGTAGCYNICNRSDHPGSEVSRRGGLTTFSRHPDLFSENGKKVGNLLKETKPEHFSKMGKTGGKKTTLLHREEQLEWLKVAREISSTKNKVSIEIEDKYGVTMRFNSVSEAAEFIGCAATHVSRCARGRRNLVSGYKARYV